MNIRILNYAVDVMAFVAIKVVVVIAVPASWCFPIPNVEFSCQKCDQRYCHCCDSKVSSIALASHGNKDTAKQAKCTNTTDFQ